MNQTEFQKLKQDLQDSYDRLDQIKDVLDQAKDSTDLFDLLFNIEERYWKIIDFGDKCDWIVNPF